MLDIEEMEHYTFMYKSLITLQKGLNITIWWQEEITMSKRQKKKSPVVEEEP